MCNIIKGIEELLFYSRMLRTFMALHVSGDAFHCSTLDDAMAGTSYQSAILCQVVDHLARIMA